MGFFKKASRLRKILLIFATLFLLLIGFISYKVFWDPENTKQVFYPLSQEDRGLLRHGDIILRKGYGMFSDGLVEVQDGPYRVSHCAMILDENQNWKVVHALSSSVATFDGAQRQNLQRFLNESIPGSIIVVRFKSTPDTINQIANRAAYYADAKKPFDHQFNNKDTTAYYCTELFQKAFYHVLKRDIFHAQLRENNTGIYDLSTFQDTSLFEVVINHQNKK
jgi:uncharacterized protein YycO